MPSAFFFAGIGGVTKRACVFVDGENFRHAIGDLFEDFDRADYLPKKASWADLFDYLVAQTARAVTCSNVERIRTYWYVVAHVDFFPYKFPDPDAETDRLLRLLSKNRELKDQLEALEGTRRLQRMKETVESLRARQGRMNNRFNGWINLQNEISLRHLAIEFRRAGAIRYDLFERSFGPEKAVDIKLAIDLLMLRDIYDIAVIVSGDQDYVPAVEAVKDFGKTVVNVAFKTRGGKLLPGGARRLNQITDNSLHVEYPDLSRHLFRQ